MVLSGVLIVCVGTYPSNQLICWDFRIRTCTAAFSNQIRSCLLRSKIKRGLLLEKKIFWAIFMVLGLIADFTLPLIWSLILTLPILVLSWWIAYRSDWFS